MSDDGLLALVGVVQFLIGWGCGYWVGYRRGVDWVARRFLQKANAASSPTDREPQP